MHARTLLAFLSLLTLVGLGCTDSDEFEPNDTVDTAMGIINEPHFENEGVVVRGVLDPGDIDHWSLTLLDDSVLIVSVEEDGEGEFHDPLLGIYDADGVLRATNDDGGPNLLSRIAFDARFAGTYTIVVTGFGDDDFDGQGHDQAFPYRMTVAVAFPPEIVTELETAGENDDPAQAEPIGASTDALVVRGALTPGDIDHYAFTLPAQARATVGLYDDVGGEKNDTVLQLLDDQGTLIAEDDDGGRGFLSNLQVAALPAGNYVLAVTGFPAGGAPHTEDFAYRLVLGLE